MNRPELTLVLLGFGHVARRFIQLLGECSERLEFSWKVAGISTRHHGSVVDPAGVDVRRALSTVDGRQSLDRLDPAPRERSGIDVIRQVADALADDAAEGRLVCIESTVLDIDRGEPAVLTREIARLRRSSRRLIWLNPLLGSANYEPLTRGMQAALPHLDHLLPGNSIASLEALARLLEEELT